MPLTVIETGKTLAYAPFYLALARLPEGSVARLPAPAPGMAARAVLDGSADFCIGGLMRVLKEFDSNEANRLVCFADLVSRDAMVLVGRADLLPFTLDRLAGTRLGAYAETPTAWMALSHDLATAEISGVDVRFATLADNADAMRRGDINAMQAPVDLAQQLGDEGFPILHHLGQRGGEVHTCLYALPSTLADRRAEIAPLVEAVEAVLGELPGMSAAAIAADIDRVEPSLAAGSQLETLERYKSMHIWATTTCIAAPDFARMKAFLRAAGFISGDPHFDQLVDTSFSPS